MSLFDKAAGLASQLAAKAKAAARNISEIELKVEEATNNDAWGPHGKDMADIAQAALDVEKFNLIMGVIEQRMMDKDENWRHVYKSMLLMEFILRHGPLRMLEYLTLNKDTLEHLAERFEYRDPNGKDQGVNVRQRAKELLALIKDPDRVRQEREKAAKNSGKYTGVSSEDFRRGGVGSPKAFERPTQSQSSFTPASPALQAPSMAPATNRIDDEDEDPMEATRRRIQALKMEGAIPDGPITPVKPLPAEEEGSGKKVKKLSDIAVDPSISAALGGFPVIPSPARPTTTTRTSNNLLSDFDAFSSAPTVASTSNAASNPAASEWNAFDSFQSASTGAAPPAAPAVTGGWDAFGSSAAAAPAPPSAAVQDDWSGFASASGTSKPSQPPRNTANIEAMLNIGSAPVPSGGPLPMEAFSSLPLSPPLGVRPPTGAMSPITGSGIASPGMGGMVHPGMMPLNSTAGPGLGPPLHMDAFSTFQAASPVRPPGAGAFPGAFQAVPRPMGPSPGFSGAPPLSSDPFADPFAAPVVNVPVMQTMPITFNSVNKAGNNTPDKPKIGPEAAAAAKKKDPFSDLLSI